LTGKPTCLLAQKGWHTSAFFVKTGQDGVHGR
jgi:hypothetical protein